MDGVRFNPDGHLYTKNGAPVPGVTTVLKSGGMIDLSSIPKGQLDAASKLGTAVHKMTEFYDNGTLDVGVLGSLLARYLEVWKKFLREMDVQVYETELLVYCKKHHYAGTLDKLATVNGADYVLDIKTGQPRISHAPQTAAYDNAISNVRRLRACVYMTPDGYKFDRKTDRSDIDAFLSCLSIHNYKGRKS